MTAVRLLVALWVLLSASLVAASPPINYRHELPLKEDITNPPSLDRAEREELREYLGNLAEYYKVRHWDAVGEEYVDLDPWIELKAGAHGAAPGTVSLSPGFPGELLRNGLNRGEFEDWDQRTRRWVRAPLRPQDDPWIFETAWGLLAEEPVDWETLLIAATIKWKYVEYDPRWTRIAEYLLELPMVATEQRGLTRNAVQNAGGWRHFIIHWPENASETLAKAVTLPYQPGDRRLMPPDPGASADTVREQERRWASEVMNNLDRWATPEELAEVAEAIEAEMEAGAFELDAETEEWLESIRQ